MFCIGSLDSVLVKEINIRTLDIVTTISIIMCNFILSYYVNKHVGSTHFLHTVLDIFPMDLTRRIC